MKMSKKRLIGVLFSILRGIMISKITTDRYNKRSAISINTNNINLNTAFSENIPKTALGEVYNLIEDIINTKLRTNIFFFLFFDIT